MVKGAMIAAAAAVPSAIWQWCTQLMAPRHYMGSDESMVVWFGSADVGSAVVDANRLIMGICREINGNKLQLYLARMTMTTSNHGAVATYSTIRLIGGLVWWRCR